MRSKRNRRNTPPRQNRARWRARRSRGFTLMELMIVISIMLILVSIAVPNFTRSITQAREAVLRQNLFTLRDLISRYTLDKQKAPQSLEDLVSAGYLKQIPNDPITGGPNWTVEQAEDTVMSPDEQDQGGIVDVHSSATQNGSNGTAYNTW
jgi:general secretion pathway protein G